MAQQNVWPSRWFDLPITVFDLETTGFDSRTCQIIEIGMVKFYRGEVEASVDWLIDPECTIPEEVVKLTNIHPADVEGKPKFREIAKEVLSWFDGRGIVAYNINFDRTFLKAKLEAIGLEWPKDNPWIDPFLFAQHFHANRGNKLIQVAEWLGVSLEGAHRACNDAEATGRVYYALLEKFSKELPAGLNELLEVQSALLREHNQRRSFWQMGNSGGDGALEEDSRHTLSSAYVYTKEETDPLRALYRLVPTKKRDENR